MIVLADYVELETGTGAVHTAPGHGEDDFETGVRYGLPIINPVDAGGRFTAEAGPYAGLQIFEANARIVDDLRASGALVASESYDHSYPHCWRCKNPVVFRATAQWFIGMDRNALRERSERAVHDVQWMPEWGETRMSQMVGNHPEWCVSRQRVWGTPIPAVVCTACNESVLDPQLARSFAKAMRARSFDQGNASDLWWTEPVEAFAPPGLACATLRRHGVREGTQHRRHLVRVRRDVARGARRARDEVPGRRVPRRRRPIPRLVPLEPDHVGRDARRRAVREGDLVRLGGRPARPRDAQVRRQLHRAPTRRCRSTARTCCGCGSHRPTCSSATCASARRCSTTFRTSTATCATGCAFCSG